ncbi:putative beta-glucosidase K [Colletotrichum trifolii]|uniref:beta-glucosidase n=1 Tax=Colletotrichum trifolii TaxID=5466 RepID=A0A4R8QNS6_COLTR|nr:putative beta-glucosidase K [Colletotrichum trifolii]
MKTKLVDNQAEAMGPHPSRLVDVDRVLDEATLAEKISLLAGSDFWHSTPLPQHGVPAVKCTDGPNGVRGSRFFNPVPALCIPCGSGLGATWNPALVEQAGQLLSKECDAKGAHVWLGPTVNIIRSPLNGRGFESFSEDAHLGGVLAAAIIRGVQVRGTLAALKHFVANDQETDKMSIDVRMSDRALREIYLKPFQIALRDSNPRVVMSSYNKVQGVHVSESHKMLQDILRKEWGFDGLIMSDWYGTYSCEAALNAGVDMEMPGPSRYREKEALAAVFSAKVHHHTIDERARQVLDFVNDAASAQVGTGETTRDVPEDRDLNRRLAGESVVLLKNSDNFLPLSVGECDEVAVIGPNADLAAACGGGSASLRPYYTSSVLKGIRDSLPASAEVHHEAGVYGHILLPAFSAERVRNDDGEPGATIELFNEPHAVRDGKAFDRVSIPDTTYQLMDYRHPEKGETFYMSMRAHFVPEHTDTYEFGLATYGVGDLYINDELVIDNSTAQTPGGMFFGKGSAEVRATYEMTAGQTYSLRVEAGSASTSKVTRGSLLAIPGGACRLGGCRKITPSKGIQRAVELAKKCRYTVVVAGLNADLEKEGRDRETMDMPPHVDELISAVLAAQPNAVIVTQAGNPVSMPWRHEAKTMLHSWYGGNEAGNAVADVLFGRVNPSGRLPMTFPARLEDNPAFLGFGSDNGKVHYSEDVFVGYRWYEARKMQVAFPFGHGLSYTTFAISDLRVSSSLVEVNVENTGRLAGAEVVRLYVGRAKTSSKSRFARPPRELAGFSKVFLEPGEKRTVTLRIDRYGTAVWDEKRDSWCCEKGAYTASVVGGDSALDGDFELQQDSFWKGL